LPMARRWRSSLRKPAPFAVASSRQVRTRPGPTSAADRKSKSRRSRDVLKDSRHSDATGACDSGWPGQARPWLEGLLSADGRAAIRIARLRMLGRLRAAGELRRDEIGLYRLRF